MPFKLQDTENISDVYRLRHYGVQKKVLKTAENVSVGRRWALYTLETQELLTAYHCRLQKGSEDCKDYKKISL